MSSPASPAGLATASPTAIPSIRTEEGIPATRPASRYLDDELRLHEHPRQRRPFMNRLFPFAAILVLASLGPALPLPARAAQSYDNCTGFIDSVPATVSTQGTWCLRHDANTAITSG